MNLWIRSQDKKVLFICNKIWISQFYDIETERDAQKAYDSAIDASYYLGSSENARKEGNIRKQKIYDKSIIYYSINCEDGKLGVYETENRTLEILNEIQNKLDMNKNNTIYEMPLK